MQQAPGHANDYETGMAAFSTGDYPRAIAYLSQIAAGSCVQATLARFYVGQSHLRMGMRCFNAGRYAAAASHFRKTAQISPAAGGLHGYLANCYIALRRHGAAAAALAKAVEADRGDVTARIRYALLTWKQGQPAKAEEILRAGCLAVPRNAELSYQLAVLLASADRVDEAIPQFQETIRLDHNHARAYVKLAQCFAVTRQFDEAISHLQQAQAIEPRNPMIALHLSLLAGERIPRSSKRRLRLRVPPVIDTDDRAAMERLATIVRAEPEFIDAFLALPPSQIDMELFGALLSVLQRCLQDAPDYADLRHRCSQVLERLGRVDEAIDESQHALTVNPRYIAALIQLAQLYQTTQRVDDAIDRLNAAIGYGANYADVHYLLGRLYERKGRIAEARSAYEQALSINEHYADARKALSALAA